MNSAYREIIEYLGPGRVKVNESLKNYTTFRLGGPADLFYKAASLSDLLKALSLAERLKVNYFLLGQGSNIIFSDSGFRGLIIKNETGNINFKGLTGRRLKNNNKGSLVDNVFLEVESGVTVNRLVRYTISQGLSGLEYFLGQPGTVGGAIWINAHNVNQGKFFGDSVVSSNLYRPRKGVIEVPGSYFRFGYDRSVIQKTKEISLSTILSLARDNKEKLWTIARKALEYRQKTQPTGGFSAGCLFRNITKSQAIRLSTPNYTCSAGFLLEQAGLKGKAVGGISFSDSHTNFLLNSGSGSFSDVLKLIDLARSKVYQKFGVNLELEVVIVKEG